MVRRVKVRPEKLLICAVVAMSIALPSFAETRPPLAPAIAASPALKALRRSMLDGNDIGMTNLRRLADAGDGLAAFNFAKALEENGGKWQDLIHYYSLALYQGRDFVARRVINQVKLHGTEMDTLGDRRRQSVEDALLAASRRGNRDAALALSDFYAGGVPFGLEEVKAAKLLEPYAREGDGKAALKIALLWIGSDPTKPNDLAAAREMLELAAASGDIGTRSTAENLLATLPTEIAAEETLAGETE